MERNNKDHAINIRVSDDKYEQMIEAKSKEYPNINISMSEWLRSIIDKHLSSSDNQ